MSQKPHTRIGILAQQPDHILTSGFQRLGVSASTRHHPAMKGRGPTVSVAVLMAALTVFSLQAWAAPLVITDDAACTSDTLCACAGTNANTTITGGNAGATGTAGGAGANGPSHPRRQDLECRGEPATRAHSRWHRSDRLPPQKLRSRRPNRADRAHRGVGCAQACRVMTQRNLHRSGR